MTDVYTITHYMVQCMFTRMCLNCPNLGLSLALLILSVAEILRSRQTTGVLFWSDITRINVLIESLDFTLECIKLRFVAKLHSDRLGELTAVPVIGEEGKGKGKGRKERHGKGSMRR